MILCLMIIVVGGAKEEELAMQLKTIYLRLHHCARIVFLMENGSNCPNPNTQNTDASLQDVKIGYAPIAVVLQALGDVLIVMGCIVLR